MDENSEKTPSQKVVNEKSSTSQNTAMAILAYIIFFVPLLTESKDDPFVKFHVKQGLVLFIAWIANMAVGIIPVLGWIIAPLVSLGLIVLMVLGIINAANGKEEELPIIGKYAHNFKI
jgi:uncharacterized membrane protein